MSNPIYSRMYSSAPAAPKAKPEQTPAERQKAAARVLGGMKGQGVHVKQVMIGEELVDVPKVEYLKLLEEQLKDARTRLTKTEDRYQKLLNNHNRAVAEINAIKRDMATLHKLLDNKIDLR